MFNLLSIDCTFQLIHQINEIKWFAVSQVWSIKFPIFTRQLRINTSDLIIPLQWTPVKTNLFLSLHSFSVYLNRVINWVEVPAPIGNMNQQLCNEYKMIEVGVFFCGCPPAQSDARRRSDHGCWWWASDSENWKKLTCVRLPSAADSEILAQSILYIFTVADCVVLLSTLQLERTNLTKKEKIFQTNFGSEKSLGSSNKWRFRIKNEVRKFFKNWWEMLTGN